GASVTLRKPAESEPDGALPMILVDRIRYNDRLPWPTRADGGGPALQRREAADYGNDAINWIASFSGGTPGDFAVPPQVTEVLVRGSDWTAELLVAISAGGLGTGGFSIRGGDEQLRPIPWQDVDQVIVRFSEAVTVTAGNLSLIGVNTSQFDVVAFDYDTDTFTATWTLASPLAADKILLELSEAVHDVTGLPLDGHWDTGNTFPSGDGAIGSGDSGSDDAFRFRLNVLPGDVTADEVVDRGDLLALVHRLGTGMGESHYDARLDVRFDGQVDLSDLREVLRRLSIRLPSGEPNETGGEPARIAVDAVFERIGNSPSPAAYVARRATESIARRDISFRSPPLHSSAPRRSTRSSALQRLQAAAIDRALRNSALAARTTVFADESVFENPNRINSSRND
ncbi:MAG: hypothetical protein IIA67_00340, partial [Planctomycetes bacterium]|nr:hypothetical protein [Planctomycetota bacterium]